MTDLDRPVYSGHMTRQRDTKTELIKVGMELIGAQGYNATGIGAVLKQAGVPKGSFYHHFESKEEFGLAIIEAFTERFLARLDVFLSDDTLTPLNRLRVFLEKGLAQLESHSFNTGCLIGDLAQELAAQNERLRNRLDTVLASWSERFSACLHEAQQVGELPSSLDPDMVAGLILSGWEGAVLRSKVMKSPKPVREFLDILFAVVLKNP
ncbi:TetR family transcriptional regulator [Desulfuromonas versatilis]|uniref:TetR family transcriptional regulator n=1 Tax=Desulfuromonas versatilis TaxID=2802975 RepID=A0ABN6DSH2_9BACT|nr:TetR/AcrR family transcriptional regulator [Desulfuromonas versatilis]BCR03148.1 TetR family transcriptional regulator [Desulfuromonas versatilis]